MAALTKDDLADLPARACRYERHRPESTLLYQIIQEHWPRFQEHLADQGKQLPAYVVEEFEAFMACGRLDQGFLRVQCEACHAERLVAFSCKRRGFCGSCGARRMADSAAHLVDHVFPDRPARQWVLVTKQSGFSLHAGVSCKAGQQKKLERLCRYITRPAISEQRLSIASNGNVIYALKTPYSDGTTHVVLSPLEFIGRLAALVPKPRVNLTRFHGVFSPNSKLREKVVPAKPLQNNPSSGKPGVYGQTWAQRLKRVFAIDIEKCEKCGGNMKVIASIEDPDVIDKILKHLGLDQSSSLRGSPHNRSPPENMFEHKTTLF